MAVLLRVGGEREEGEEEEGEGEEGEEEPVLVLCSV